MKELIPAEIIKNKIYLIRGQKVMLDKDLAVLYGVKPIRLREQVKRDLARFPDDFMFQLNEQEIVWYRKMRYLPESTLAATIHMSLQSRVLQCWREFLTAREPFKLTSLLCGHL